MIMNTTVRTFRSRCVNGARAAAPAVLTAAVVVAVGLGVARVGVATALDVVGLLALGALTAAAAALAAAAVVIRRRVAQLRHLPDLGRPYVTTYDEGLVTGLSRDATGSVVVEVASTSRHTLVLDDQGAPDHVDAGGASTACWRVPSSPATPQALGVLTPLVAAKVPVRVVSEGVVALTGPVAARWRLEAANGLVLTSRA